MYMVEEEKIGRILNNRLTGHNRSCLRI